MPTNGPIWVSGWLMSLSNGETLRMKVVDPEKL
jgi:hypothetical protein